MEKPTLLYSDPDYNYLIPIDIAPSLLTDLLGNKILIVCAREGMIMRLNSCLSQNPLYQGQEFDVMGIWEVKLDNIAKLVHNYQKVVIVGKSRIHQIYLDELKAVEKACLP